MQPSSVRVRVSILKEANTQPSVRVVFEGGGHSCVCERERVEVKGRRKGTKEEEEDEEYGE